MLKPFTLVTALSVAALMTCCSSRGGLHSATKPHVSADARREAIRRAQVWEKTDVAAKDLTAGPDGHGAFKPEETVNCRYDRKQLSGNSPKFTCVIPPADEVKVKFGRDNGEVYAEVAATRLFWALGFPADRMYPVKVSCDGCPPIMAATPEKGATAVLFDPAAIERKFKGHVIETAPDSGWAWSELDEVQEAAGGAPQAQRDALKLLAVFVQHTDNKAAQQRLICVDEHAEDHVEKGRCAHPVMMVNDLGQTFGRSNLFNRDAVGSVNLQQWSAAPIWSDPKACIGELPPSQTGSLQNPQIREAGRKFLSDLLMQLTDGQLRDLFAVARFEHRTTNPNRPGATVDEWVAAFKKKRGEIASLTCPS
ncbi:MAG: hypothetical protein JWL71_2158 [Acidobacteria bacterium]|nr:hypothetical protein [Acidobacteriota bacterium]